MHLLSFSIKDKKTGLFERPFFARSIVEASRAVGELVNDANHHLSKFASDYALHCIGTFDDEKGDFHAKVDFVADLDVLKVVDKLAQGVARERT